MTGVIIARALDRGTADDMRKLISTFVALRMISNACAPLLIARITGRSNRQRLISGSPECKASLTTDIESQSDVMRKECRCSGPNAFSQRWKALGDNRFKAQGYLMRKFSIVRAMKLSFFSKSPLPHSAPASRLVYPPINPARQLRVVKIIPAPKSTPIRCELLCYDLKLHDPQYDALSYCWGPATDKTWITCNGQRLDVTRDLERALQRFRSPDVAVFLWIDQICIDQENLAERGKQVELMRYIYRRAKSVTIWLGDEADDSRLAFVFVRAMVPLLEFLQTSKNEQQVRRERFPPLNSVEWRSVSALLSRPWFGRMWVLQEYTLARSAKVVCGKDMMLWEELSRFISLMEAERGRWFYLFKSNQLEGVSANFLRERLRYMLAIKQIFEARNRVELMENLMYSRWFQATDPRDKIYAVLGLSTKVDITVDYTKEVQDVFRDTANLILFHQRALSPDFNRWKSIQIMGILAEVERTERKYALPSWVPDWTASVKDSLFMKAQLFAYNAAGSTLVQLSQCDDPNRICMSGKIVDEVQRTGVIGPLDIDNLHFEPFKGKKSKDFYQMVMFIRHHLNFWVNEASSIAADCQRYPNADSRREAFWRTLLCNRGVNDSRHDETDPKYGKWYRDFRSYLAALCPGEGAKAMDLEYLHKLSMPHLVGFWEMTNIMGGVVPDRRFFSTLGGYMGLGPARMQPGDLVCVFLGGLVPWIIRRRVDAYILVGECYVHGLMNGEAIESEHIPVKGLIIE